MLLFSERARDWPAPYFELPSWQGAVVRRSDYRDRCNLVLVFCSAGETGPEAATLAARKEDLAAEEGEILWIVRDHGSAGKLAARIGSTMPILIDESGRVRDSYLSLLPAGDLHPSFVMLLDRYGAPVAVWWGEALNSSQLGDEILAQLQMLQVECPE
ncbi:MAG: hypothetical protein D6775_04465 [Caldilineae bacterium]|nr:MAG: hypothetical protein D6775_04465 [Caldilineae bacterium]